PTRSPIVPELVVLCIRLRALRLCSRRSGNASAIAHSFTGSFTWSALAAAPAPRLPQPIRAILIVSSAPACTGEASEVMDVAAAATAEVCKKLRRDRVELLSQFEGIFFSKRQQRWLHSRRTAREQMHHKPPPSQVVLSCAVRERFWSVNRRGF